MQLEPLRIRIDRIVDSGTVVSLIGVDTETAMPVTIHIDHRPFADFRKAWHESGLTPSIEYEADRLTVRLDMLPENDAEKIRLIELKSSTTEVAKSGRRAVPELDR